MDDGLSWVEFDPASMMDLVADFRCGDAWYQEEVRSWLLEDSPREVSEGVRIWLYVDRNGDVAGFGSLAIAVWPCDAEGRGERRIAVVPALALHQNFHGGFPPGVPPHRKYKRQVMSHLLREADRLTGIQRVVGLFVHDENVRAIERYESFGFRRTSHDYHDAVKQTTYRFFARALSEGPSRP